MPSSFGRWLQAVLAIFALAAGLYALVFFQQEREAPPQWCNDQGCLSVEWAEVADRIVDNDLYLQAAEPDHLLTLFLMDLGSLQHQRGAVFQFLMLTLDKDRRFAAIASAMVISRHDSHLSLEQVGRLRREAVAFWRGYPGDGFWLSMLTGVAPRENWTPAQHASWARLHQNPGE
ncbi:hypothetical protein FCL40_04030 [Ferrimonas sediminicola]|uniref:Uncharacterized protein n=1 Tax=Ferrimonas sediminicola TaxID=2569538 RepID=A0A4V5NVG2_9GAMM|nr:hypothetical protein [Ferrimonas sediminicola]TKB50333.1 hypothetical protein FCL40_04030 [Ferrimonas sediminicola]